MFLAPGSGVGGQVLNPSGSSTSVLRYFPWFALTGVIGAGLLGIFLGVYTRAFKYGRKLSTLYILGDEGKLAALRALGVFVIILFLLAAVGVGLAAV
jgi:hypothetical protein